MNEQTIIISGMTCGACINLVTKILSRMKGIRSVLSVEKGLAKVSVDTHYSKEAFAHVFTGTPYTVESITL